MTHQKPTSLNRALLYLLYRTGKLAIDSITISRDISHWHKAFMDGGLSYVNQVKQLQNEKMTRATLQHLKYRKFIKAKKIGNRMIVTLTDKGKETVLKESIRRALMNQDGYYTVVIFDIPESQKNARQQLRLFLKECNFKKLQLSVWVSDKDVIKPLSQLIMNLKIDEWVNVFKAKDFLRKP